jgi:hypothetical protein
VTTLMLGFSVTLTMSHVAVVVIAAQIGLALLIVASSTFLTRLLHDCVPSTIRAGVSSGVGTLTWIAFLPFALAFGALSQRAGVHAAGWMIVAITALTSASLVGLAWRRAVAPTPCRPAPTPAAALA